MRSKPIEPCSQDASSSPPENTAPVLFWRVAHPSRRAGYFRPRVDQPRRSAAKWEATVRLRSAARGLQAKRFHEVEHRIPLRLAAIAVSEDGFRWRSTHLTRSVLRSMSRALA